MSGPTKVEQFGFSPEQLNAQGAAPDPGGARVRRARRPGVVAGLGAGLDRSTFTNMAEAREAAYEQAIIPTQRILGEDIRFQLLPSSSRPVRVAVRLRPVEGARAAGATTCSFGC
jgi:hypothetical protein